MDEILKQCTELMNQMGGMMGSTGGRMMGGMMGGNAIGGGMMTAGMGLASPWYWLGWVLVIAALFGTAVAVVWAIRGLGANARQTETPLAILQRRFAGGEITAQQFADMKKQLS